MGLGPCMPKEGLQQEVVQQELGSGRSAGLSQPCIWVLIHIVNGRSRNESAEELCSNSHRRLQLHCVFSHAEV